MAQLEVLVDGLTFPEAPRWHDERLWFSDFYAHRVLAASLDGTVEEILHVPGQPSGLGWLPDGRLLVVSMLDRRVLRREADGTVVIHADLFPLATGPCNDMVVDGSGRAWVGNFGFDRHVGQEPATTVLVRVDPDGKVTRAAEDVFFPNGSVITPDGGTLIVGETFGQRLSAWDVGGDGTLSGRRVWADTTPHWPDGICLDAEGAIWVADPRGDVAVRVHEGGRISRRIPTGRGAFACMLGGPEGHTLFVCTCSASGPAVAPRRDGRIEHIEVDVPGAGWP